ncbi:MAG: glycosyltransferase [Fulvivirga sp.]
MQKTKLVIASILKPVDDTRMYEKFGLSLSQTNKYDINIIGFYSKNIPTDPNITFHPLFNFKRISLRRVFAPYVFLKRIIKVKPQVLIVNTHELLIVAFIYKILFGTKLIYDIRENYFRNIIHTAAFVRMVRPLIAGYVRLKEYASTLFVDQYILAEKAYRDELKFVKNKVLIIENKYRPSSNKEYSIRATDKLKLLFTGTIGESTGIFEAINIAKALYEIEPSVELNILGYCAKKETYHKLLAAIDPYAFIHLQGGDHLVPHNEIINAIHNSDFGIIYYPKNPSTVGSTPTKLYEYLGSQLPVLIQKHQAWNAIVDKYNAGLVINLKKIDYTDLHKKMQSQQFYEKVAIDELLWSSEESKLLDCIDNL